MHQGESLVLACLLDFEVLFLLVARRDYFQDEEFLDEEVEESENQKDYFRDEELQDEGFAPLEFEELLDFQGPIQLEFQLVQLF